MRKVLDSLRRGSVAKRRHTARLGFDVLEDRCVPTVDTGSISGLAFLNVPSNGLAGATISLTGTPTDTTVAPVNLDAVTSASGSFTFTSLPAGAYHLSAGPFTGLIGSVSFGSVSSSPGITVDDPVAVTIGATAPQNFAVQGGIGPDAITMSDFLTSTTGTTLPFEGTGGLGTPDNTPFVTTALAPVTLSAATSTSTIDLAGHFGDNAITNSEVTMNVTANGKSQQINLDLSDTTAPQAVANFFDYVNAGAYDNNIFFRNTDINITGATDPTSGPIVITAADHGLSTGSSVTISGVQGNTAANGTWTVTVIDANTFSLNGSTGNGTYTTGGTFASGGIGILQAGGAVVTDGSGPSANSTLFPTIPDEISALNLQGTLATANTGAANSASNQFFFNTQDNPGLDHAVGSGTQGYTVFGTVADPASLAVLEGLTAAPVTDSNLSSQPFGTSNPNFLLNQVPLTSGAATSFPTAAADYLVINSITTTRRDDFLTYQVSSSDPTLVTASLNSQANEQLTLTEGTGVGTSTITVTATDRFGASTTQTFTVTVTGVPVVSSVTIIPDNPTATTVLTATPTATDPNSLTPTFTYQWLQGTGGNTPTAINGQTNQTLTLTGLTVNVGDTFSVQVTPKDTDGTGTAFTSQTVTVATISPAITLEGPVVTSVALAANTPSGATQLTATPSSTDPNSLPVTYTYQWLQGTGGNTPTAINGQTQQTLSLTGLTVAAGDTFAVQVIPSDSTIAGAAFTSPSLQVATGSPAITFSPPVVSAVSIVPDDALGVNQLTAAPTASDPNGLPITESYQWLENAQQVGGNVQTLSLAGLTINPGATFSVEVTPSDGVASGSQFTSNTVTVATTTSNAAPITLAPVVTAAPITPNDATNTNVTSLVVTPVASDPNAETPTFSYQWLQTPQGSATPVAVGQNAPTLDLTTLTVNQGDTFTVQITPTDNTATGPVFTSTPVTIATAPPNPITLS